MEGISEATRLDGSNGFTVSFIRSIVDECRDEKEGSAPKVIDHHMAKNPYQSRYGDQWVEKIKESTHMKKL
eukprot:11424731-Ditylum_brightwellii.AAC.1